MRERASKVLFRIKCGRLLLVSALGGLALPVEAGNLYRFRNADGGLVIASSIPNDRVPLGYEVIDSSSGRLLQTIAPQLTPREAAAKAEWERRLNLCETAQRRVQTMYESLEDIDAAELQALESIDTRILNAQASLAHARNQRSEFEETAARMERNGGGVPPTLVGNLQRASIQIDSLEQEIAQRQSEKVTVRREYDQDREVFKISSCEVAANHRLFDQVAEG